jgi:hypothetical protein
MSSSETQSNRALSDAVAGTLAALISLWSFYPLDVYKTLIQGCPAVSSSTKLHFLLAGIQWKSAHTAASNFVYFYLYSSVQCIVRKRHRQQSPSVLLRLLMAAVAAIGNTFVTLPLDVISTQEQQQQQIHMKHQSVIRPQTFPTPSLNFAKIQQYASELSKYWKGLLPSLLLCANPSIHYTVFDSIRHRILHRNASHQQNRPLHWMEAFCLGAIAKLVATIATYPLIRAKMLIMTQSIQGGLWNTLRKEYNERGCSGLYQGCRLQLLHTLLKSALLMMIRERLTEVTHNFLGSDKPLV